MCPLSDVFRCSFMILFTICLMFYPLPSICKKGGSCKIDSSWIGKWFEYGERDGIIISSQNITHKGNCIYKNGGYHIFKDTAKGCLRCAAMHQKHANVIQYKESICQIGYENRPMELCYNIKTDEGLKSLFRINGSLIDCPISGSHQLSYSRGYETCEFPKSFISQCIDKSKLVFRYQACPDIKGSESLVETMECLASWKEGSVYYFLGLLNDRRGVSESMSIEDRFRCHVYEHIHRGYLISQSEDGKCNLYTAKEGVRTMRLKQVNNNSSPCLFPTWLTSQTNLKYNNLNGSLEFIFHRVGSFLSLGSTNKEKRNYSCSRMEENSYNYSRLILLAHIECEIGFMCLEIFKRDENIISLKMGKISRNSDEACHKHLFFDTSSITSITLISQKKKNYPCPLIGKYRLTKPSRDCFETQDFLSGCSEDSSIEFLKPCASPLLPLQISYNLSSTEVYQCHGGWTEKNVNENKKKRNFRLIFHYFILSSSFGPPYFCGILREEKQEDLENTGLQLSFLVNDCIFENEKDDSLVKRTFELARTSHCAQALATGNNGHTGKKIHRIFSLSAFFLLLTLIVS